MADKDYLLVAAFDLGTTFSGYAYSFRDSPEHIRTNNAWVAGSQNLISQKTPTCVLLNQDKEFDSFGYEAENKFADLAEDNEHKEWFMFRHFKMLLYHNKKLSRDTVIFDINGKPMSALSVFAMSLKYLRDHLLNDIERHTGEIVETDIEYVITVPTIWSDSAKQFMREAAVKAGFDTKRLQFALEPEAASIWCRTESGKAKAAISGFETKYAVVDLGGGTADITFHEINRDDTLKEWRKPSGGPWGGTYVDKNFLNWISDIFGTLVIERFKSEGMSDYFELLRDFETKKRKIDFDGTTKCTFKLPLSLMNIFEEENEISLREKICSLECAGEVRLLADKLRIDNEVMISFFEKPVNKLIKHLQDIMHEGNMKKVSTILLVGGFGESKFVQNKVKEKLKTKLVLTPYDAGLVVVKGAVVFGHNSKIISGRVMKCRYGFKVHVAYNPSKHDEDKMFILNGEKRIYVFREINKLDEMKEVGESRIVKNMQPNQLDSTKVKLYASDKSDVHYVTDASCNKLATLTVHHPEGKTLLDKKFDLIFIFGETELIVKARIQKTCREFILSVNCLDNNEI